MESQRIVRCVSAVAGGLAIVAMVGLSASCAKKEEKAPETSTTTTTTTPTTTSPAAPPTPVPTEKSINPTGGNLFTPPVYAPPAPTAPPGLHPSNYSHPDTSRRLREVPLALLEVIERTAPGLVMSC